MLITTGRCGLHPEMATESSIAATAPATVPPTSAATTPNPAESGTGDPPARTEVWLDVRDMEPPEPLVRTLEALENLPAKSMLVQLNMRVRNSFYRFSESEVFTSR